MIMAVWFCYIMLFAQGLSGMVVEANNRQVGGNSQQEGVISVQDGVKDLKDGVINVQDGVKDLKDGVISVQDGVKDLKDGVISVQDGVKDLKDGVISVQDGVKDLKDGVISVQDGVKDLKDGVISVQDGVKDLKEGCVMAVTIFPRHSLSSVDFNLTVRDTPHCQEKEKWNAQLKLCGDENQSDWTEKINTFGRKEVTKTGQYKLVIFDGENHTSTCEHLKGFEFDEEELKVYMEFNDQRVIVKMAEADPRVRKVQFMMYEGTSKECGDFSKKYRVRPMVPGEELVIPGPFKPSLQYCFKWHLYGHHGAPSLIYPITVSYVDNRPAAVSEKQPEFKWWRVGVGVGVVLVVVGGIVIVLVVLSKKIWIPSSPADPTVKTIWGPKTVEVLLLYTSDVEQNLHLRSLKKKLSASWTVLDLNEVLPKRRAPERLADRNGWLLKVIKQEEGVKVVVVESAKLLNLQASILEGNLDRSESTLERFQRNALRNILAMGATDYHKIFVVRFNEEVCDWRERREKVEDSPMMDVCRTQPTKTSPGILLGLTIEPQTQAEKQSQAQTQEDKQSQSQKQAQTQADKQSQPQKPAQAQADKQSQPQKQAKTQTDKQSQPQKQPQTQADKQSPPQKQAQTPPASLTTKTQTQTPPGNQTTQAQTQTQERTPTHALNTEKERLEILVKNCRYVLPGHINQLMDNLKCGGGHQV